MSFFQRNLGTAGRIVRLLWAFAMGGAAWWIRIDHPAAAVILALLGLFGLFEALRGWCIVRACGFKTPV